MCVNNKSSLKQGSSNKLAPNCFSFSVHGFASKCQKERYLAEMVKLNSIGLDASV